MAQERGSVESFQRLESDKKKKGSEQNLHENGESMSAGDLGTRPSQDANFTRSETHSLQENATIHYKIIAIIVIAKYPHYRGIQRGLVFVLAIIENCLYHLVFNFSNSNLKFGRMTRIFHLNVLAIFQNKIKKYLYK